MKRDRFLSCLIAIVLAFCVSFGGVACIVTGFSLDEIYTGRFEAEPANLPAIAVFCAVICLVAGVCFSFRWGGLGLIGCLMLLTGYLWRSGTLEIALEALLYRISYLYDLAYDCGVLQWTGEKPAEITPDMGFCIIAALSALLVTWTVCRRRNAIAAVAVGFLPLFACLVVTDTVPEVWCLFILLTGQVMLILTNTVRRKNAADGNRLTAMVLLPTTLLMTLLFYAVPSEGYKASAEKMQQSLRNWLQSLPISQMLNMNFTGANSGVVDLAELGSKGNYDYPVMDVTAPESGMLYLRGQALDQYDGKTWDASSASSYRDTGWPETGTGYVGKVSITTIISHDFLYFPYYPSGERWPEDLILTGGGVRNPGTLREYAFTQRRPNSSNTGVSLPTNIRNQCLSLPQATKTRAQRYLRSAGLYYDLQQYTGNMDIYRNAVERIGQLVRNTAKYSLDVQTMPEDAEDFAMWFLESSDTGYCVHFATTAAVLLRAAGIPARYVSGYILNAQKNREVTVTADKAHAWVEYFDPVLGWRILETTPGYDSNTFEDPTEPPETTAPTTEPSTEPTTEPSTGPTEPDDEPTEPTQETTQQEDTSEGGNDKQENKLDIGWFWTVLKWVGIAAGIFTVLAAQYVLRIRSRRKKMHTGPANHRALARWRAVLRVCRILKKEPPQALLELAEKAKFSQHDLTVAERMEFDRYLDEADLELRKMPWPKQWLLRLLWAV